MLLLTAIAFAGDVALYARSLTLIEENYLHPAQLDPRRMFLDAGAQLETAVEWLLVEADGDDLLLRDGSGDWKVTVRFDPEADLATVLGTLEDRIREARKALPTDRDLRVEILRGVTKGLDRHSVVLHAAGLARFDERLSGTLVGVGVSFTRTAGELVADAVNALGPAGRGGVLVGDRLLKIDGVSTVGMLREDVTERLNGPEGAPVVLTLRRGAEVLELTLLREEVRLRNVTAAVGPNGIGLVTIAHFSEQTHGWLQESLLDLATREATSVGVALDLRGNTGGSLVQSAEAADTFLQAGEIVSTVGRDGTPVAGLIARLDAHPDQPPNAMPLVFLMDHQTASGSEILGGSLATLDRAILIGTTSFGKGTVQKVYQVAPDIKLKLTVAEYRLAGDRRVTDIGLQPDLALAPYRFGPDGVWYPELGRERARLPAGAPLLPAVEESPGWRTATTPPPARDVAVELAARLLAAAEGANRRKLLDTLSLLQVRLDDDEDDRLVEAFGARGIDWSGPPSSVLGRDPRVRVRLDFHNAPTAGEATEIVASVRNEGPEDLYRAAIRLRSVNRLWDDQVLPLGRVNAGDARTGMAVVRVPKGIASRTDDVEILLEAARIPARVEGSRRVSLVGAPGPVIVGTARLTGVGGQTGIIVTLENRGTTLLEGVRARIPFPEAAGVELVDDGTAPASLLPGEVKTFLVRIALAPTAHEKVLPLELVVVAEGYPTPAAWPLPLARDGAILRLEPPTIQARALPETHASGTVRLSARITDDRGLDHVLVLAGAESLDRSRYETSLVYAPDKVAWKPGTGRRDEFDVDVPVRAGVNRYDIIAEDRAGLRTTTTLYVLGVDADSAVAGDSAE